MTTSSPRPAAIEAIPRGDVHRITSGQVVLDVQSAVKELIENALDAGATTIEVRFREYGVEAIEVLDNGTGIAAAQYDALALKHHTSKLRTFADLTAVQTFGFRGEALSSLCELARVHVVTATQADEPVGTVLELLRDGTVGQRDRKLARQRGTTVTVADLFHTLPVRRRALEKNAKRELAKALALLQAYAVIVRGVRWVVSNTVKGRKTVLMTVAAAATTTPAATVTTPSALLANVTGVFGPKVSAQLVPLSLRIHLESGAVKAVRKAMSYEEVDDDVSDSNKDDDVDAATVHVRGLISRPSIGSGRSSSDRCFLYVNGRPWDAPKVVRAFNEVYRAFNVQQYPIVVADFAVQGDAYDVNVSPDKRTLFLHKEAEIVERLKTELEHALSPYQAQFKVNDRASPPQSTLRFEPASTPTASPPPLPRSTLQLKSTPTQSKSTPTQSKSAPTQSKSTPTQSTSTPTQSKSTPTQSSDRTESTWLIVDVGRFANGRRRSRGANSSAAESGDEDAAPIAKVQRRRSVTLSDDEEEVEVGEEDGEVEEDEFDDTNADEEEAADVSEVEDDDDMPMVVEEVVMVEEEVVMEEEPDEEGNAEEELSEEGHSETEAPEKGVTQEETANEEAAASLVRLLAANEEEAALDDDDAASDKLSAYEATQEGKYLPFDLEAIVQASHTRRARPRAATSATTLQQAAVEQRDTCKAEEVLSRCIQKSDFTDSMHVIGQFNLGFILVRRTTEGDDDVFIIDQHAADEKYNFEMLTRTTKLESQRLVVPRALQLSPSDELVAAEHGDALCAHGFEVRLDEEAAPGSRVTLLALPMSKHTAFGVGDLEELLHLLADERGGSQRAREVRCSKVRGMLASRACRRSVMIGTALPQRQMQGIVHRLGELHQPWNCPHGRPTMRQPARLDQA